MADLHAIREARFEDEFVWLEALKNGDPAAERLLFDRYFRSMTLLGLKITGDLPAAEDIVADAFVKVFQRRAEFKEIDGIRGFLYVAVRNASYTYTAKEKRRDAVYAGLAVVQPDAGMDEAEDLEILRARLLAEIYREIENLPDQCRRISQMIFFEGKDTETIALGTGQGMRSFSCMFIRR